MSLPLFTGHTNTWLALMALSLTLTGMALIVPATMINSGWGTRLAHAVDAHMLRQLFALFLLLTSLRMFYGLFMAR